MPTQSALPTTFSLPVSGSSAFHAPSSALDFNSLVLNDCDWSRSSSIMDLDVQESGRIAAIPTSTTKRRKLEFVDGALAGLGGLDISFETSPLDDGKIRVRIHTPSTSVPSSSSSSSGSDASITPYSSLATWTSSESSAGFETSFTSPSDSSALSMYSTIESDPFLGVGTSNTFGLNSHYAADGSMPMSWYGDQDLSSSISFGHQPSEPSFGFGSEFGGKRRVRIALKSMPETGGEGGEWEVQVC